MIEKILSEISRLKEELKGYSASEALDYIEAYINTLPEDSGCEVNFTTKSEDLEEEISLWLKENCDDNGFFNQLELARHFAEWQKQQMMKDAVEGTVKYEIGSAEIPQCDRRYQVMSDPVPITNAKLGDKVKIVVLKTE